MARRSRKRKKQGKKTSLKKSLIQPTVVKFKPIQEHEGRASDYATPLVIGEQEEPTQSSLRLAKNYGYELSHRPQRGDFVLSRGDNAREFESLEQAMSHLHMELGGELCGGEYLHELPEDRLQECRLLFGEETLREFVVDQIYLACKDSFAERTIEDEVSETILEMNEGLREQARKWLREEEWTQLKREVIAEIAHQNFVVQRAIALRHCLSEVLPLPQEPSPEEVDSLRRFVTRDWTREEVVETLSGLYVEALEGVSRQDCAEAIARAMEVDAANAAALSDPSLHKGEGEGYSPEGG